MAQVRGELRDVRLGETVCPGVPVDRRGHDHHHDRDR